MTSAQLISQDRARVADLVPLLETDIASAASCIAAQSARSEAEVEAHLHWFLLENPVRTPDQPLGFGLQSFGKLVGCILCSPQVFQCQNRQILLMGSSSFYVDHPHRGQGGRIFLQYSRLAKRWPTFGTSANADAAALWKAAGATPIPHADGELFGILNWTPVAEEIAHRRTASRFVSRLAGSSASSFAALLHPLKLNQHNEAALQPLTSAGGASGLVAGDRAEKLTALRDESYIRWRYFSGKDPSVALFAFCSEFSNRQILVTVNQRRRGFRRQINTINLLDVYPEVPASEWLKIVGALIARYSRSVDALVLRNQDPEKRKMFCEAGFHWRAFDAPTSWILDRTNLLPASGWYIVPADGDGLI
jgi:hypothetical protein